MSNISKDISQNKMVVIVDDDIDLLKLLVFVFESKGFNTRGIANGNEALNFLQKDENLKHVGLLILDRILPDMDGLSILKKVPQILLRKVPVLILSLLAIEGEVNDILAEDTVDYMGKPFSLSALMDKGMYLIENHSKNEFKS